jgi:hypothetical protein
VIFCANSTCIHCRSNHLGDLVCGGEPDLFPTNDSTFNKIVICNAYEESTESKIPELYPGRGQDGLFPGQLKPNREFLNG